VEKLLQHKSTIYDKYRQCIHKSKSVVNLYKKIKNLDIFSSYNFSNSEKFGINLLLSKSQNSEKYIVNRPLQVSKDKIPIFNYEFTLSVV
jgi:hypothetical protein